MRTRLRRGLRAVATVLVTLALVTAPGAVAVVRAGGPVIPSYGAPLTVSPPRAGVVGAFRGTGPSSTAVLVDRLNAASMRPLPVAPPADVAQSSMVWVPDRYVSVPSAPGGALVPGHWERPLASGEMYVPPIAVIHPGGGSQMVPAGVRPPVESRIGP